MQIEMEQFWSKLESMGNMETLVLATSKDDVVTARPIGALRMGEEILLRTDDDSQKAVQIQANPQVAISMGPYYLRGRARILGHCTDTGNPDIQKAREVYCARWADAFSETDTFLSGKEVFVAISPTHISQWVYEGEDVEGLFHLEL